MQQIMIYCQSIIPQHVSGRLYAHHQESRLRQVGTEIQPDSASKRSHNLQEMYQLQSVQWVTPDEGHRRCPKHVGFYVKNKF